LGYADHPGITDAAIVPGMAAVAMMT